MAIIALHENGKIAFTHAMELLTDRDVREDLEAGASDDLFI
jgi:hypothetical protein